MKQPLKQTWHEFECDVFIIKQVNYLKSLQVTCIVLQQKHEKLIRIINGLNIIL